MDVVEPGTRLVSRYLLEEHLGGPALADVADDASPADGHLSGVTTTGGGQVLGATYWRARDELLDRPVSLCLLRGGSAYAERVLAAARRAAVLTDARFLRILDAAEGDGIVYVVSEWVPAKTLTDLLADGPLPAHEVRALGLEITAALAAAHEAGLDHLALQPEHVLRTPHGQVKLAGLAVDAAARDLQVADRAQAARRDAAGAAAVLYAALTGRWPGEQATGLPPAPYDGDSLCSPRQVRAGVPDDLDDVVSRALDIPGRHHGTALHSVEEMARALAAGPATARIPLAPAPPSRVAGPPSLDEDSDDASPGARSRAALAGWVLAALVLVVGVGLALTQLVAGLGGAPGPGGPASAGGVEAPGDAVVALDVASVTGFDPPPGNGEENSDRADLAVDGRRGTSWTTKDYYDPFGPTGLKTGVGLLLDLGRSHDLRQVSALLRGGATSVQLRVADRRGERVEDYRVVDEVTGADGRVTIRPKDAVSAQYVLLWLTDIPTIGGRYRGEVAEVTLRGAPST